MKTLLTAASVLTLSLVLFGGGMVAATAIITSGEQPYRFGELNTAELWTNEPVSVDTQNQPFERLPADLPEEQQTAASDHMPIEEDADVAVSAARDDLQQAGDGSDVTAEIDTLRTGDAQEQRQQLAEMHAAHMEWCSNQYRSYNAEDNSYHPYSGGVRACVSPYWDGQDVTVAAEAVDETYETYGSTVYRSDEGGEIQEAAYRPMQGTEMSLEHQQRCFATYRSYRAEDNSYQPYGGGPRQQCE